jgi:hypothetical protein
MAQAEFVINLYGGLTIEVAQSRQPWTVPYSPGFVAAAECLPHLHAEHAVLHAIKSLGRIADVLEAADHRAGTTSQGDETIEAMSADLMTIALRLANLYGFSLSAALQRRVFEKNGVHILDPSAEGEARQGANGDRNADGSFSAFDPNSTVTPGACEGPKPVDSAGTARVKNHSGWGDYP